MTGRSSLKRTSLCLLALLLCGLCSDKLLVVGEPEPIPSELLSESIKNAENLILLHKLKQVIQERKDMAEQEKALDEEQTAIQSVLEARARVNARVSAADDSGEELPTPNAVVSQGRSGKRTAISYMTLCHFKICNMGRKRHLHK